MDLQHVLRGVVPPFVVAFVLLLPRLVRGGGKDTHPGSPAALGIGALGIGALGALALGLGAAIGTGLIVGALDPLLHPVSVQHKLAWAALAAGVIGFVDQSLGVKSPGRIALRTILRFALPAALLWWLLANRRVRDWNTADAWLWTSIFAAAIAALGTGIDLIAARRPGASIPCALTAALAVAAGALVAGRAASYGQIAGAMAAALGGLTAIALLKPGLTARGAGMPVAVVLGCLMLAGYYTSELAGRTALAVFAAPLAVVLAELLPLKDRPALAGTVRVALAVLPGLLLIWLTYEAPPQPYY